MRFHGVSLGNQHEMWSKQHNGKVRHSGTFAVQALASVVASVVEAGLQETPGIWRREAEVRLRSDAMASLYLAKNSPASPFLPLPFQKGIGI
jgi:hypothetical protein